MKDTRTTLRVAVWVDSNSGDAHDNGFLQWLRSQAHIELYRLLVAVPEKVSASQIEGGSGCLGLALIEALEKRKLRRKHARPNAVVRGDSMPAADVESIPPGDEGLAKLSAFGLDLIVCLSARLPEARQLAGARLGTLAFDWTVPADRRPPSPTGFWEVFDRSSTTGFSVVLYPTGSSPASTLLRGRVPTRHYYLLNREALRTKAFHYLRQVVDRMATPAAVPAPPTGWPNSGAQRGCPSTLQCLRYLAHQWRAMLAKKVKLLAGREERWQVSFIRHDWVDAPLCDGIRIANPPGRYLADPFVISRSGRDICFVEDYDCAQARGRISAFELDAAGARFLGIVIDEPFHMSFPFLFEYDGQLLMCPETSGNRDIRIYECVEFPLVWRLKKVAMGDVHAADTMLLPHAGKWWMLSNFDPTNSGSLCSELYIHWAPSPLSDDWIPHPANPVVFDAASARNGGLLTEGDRLFRVSQRQGFDRYGEGSQINEIVVLDDERYVERCHARIDPTFYDGLLGTHHLHSDRKVTVFDSLDDAPVRSTATV